MNNEEIANKLVDYILKYGELDEHDIKNAIVNWLDKNKSEFSNPVVIGLTDEQICDVSRVLNVNPMVISGWQSKQTFNIFDLFIQKDISHSMNVELSESYNGINEENERLKHEIYDLKFKLEQVKQSEKETTDKLYKAVLLKLKYQEELEQLNFYEVNFNFDNAPTWANFICHDDDGTVRRFENEPYPHTDGCWRSNGGRYDSISLYRDDWRNSLVERPKLTIEVGQVWIDTEDNKVEIICLGFRGKNTYQICYQFIESSTIEICCNEYFLSNFIFTGETK